jgi:hypothetical protein
MAPRARQQTLHATLLASGGTPVAGVLVTFTFNGSTYTATTSAAGVATTRTFNAPNKKATYLARASFAGNATFAPASVTWNVVVG